MLNRLITDKLYVGGEIILTSEGTIMPTTSIPPQECFLLSDIQNNLPSLACHAAIEIDNLIIGRENNATAVKKLMEKMSGSFEPDSSGVRSLIDPTTAVAINRALKQSNYKNGLTSVSEVAAQTDEIKNWVTTITSRISNLSEEDKKNLASLRAFCLALSKSAAAYSCSIEDLQPRYH